MKDKDSRTDDRLHNMKTKLLTLTTWSWVSILAPHPMLARLQLDTGRQVTWHEQGQAIIRHRLDTRTLSAENISTGNTEERAMLQLVVKSQE